jgi:hypothetical protein
MNRNVRAAASAALLSSAVVFAWPAFSQQELRQQVSNQLSEHSIQVENFDSLSNDQLWQIQLILNTTEGDQDKRVMIDSLLAERDACVGNPQLRQQVNAQLQEHGIQIDNFDSVSGNELVVLEAVLNTNQSEDEKRAQIERMFTVDSPIQGSAALRAEVERCVRRLNADVNLDALTPEELVQIELIAGGSESESAKREMIEQIANE